MTDKLRNSLVWPVAGFFVVIAFGVGMISMAAFDSSQRLTPEGSTEAQEGGASIQVELGDLFIKPADFQAEAGDITFDVHNAGQTEHNFVVEGLGSTEMLAPDAEGALVLENVKAGTYNVFCAVPGHADGGMKAKLVVGESGGGDTGGAMAGMTAEEMAQHDADRTAQFPAETKGKGNVALEPEILADGTKKFELTAEAIQWEVEPGVVKEAYAYNGMVPGPRIDVNQGDKVQVVLHNESPEPTTIHFHGQIVPNAMDGVPVITQPAVMPGESFTYEFTVRNAGSHMYHSHFNAAKQVPMGLLGAFVVHPVNEQKVDQDYVMVLNDGPLGFTINGKGFPATEPIVAKQGDLIRIRYMNEGLQIHPMHLHGIPQKVVAKDGFDLPQPYMADTLLVAPGERYDVLVDATELGAWAFHCHVLSHVEGPDGMFGMVTALIVQ